MILIDAVGQPCPIPVVKAKRAMADLPVQGGVIEVRVDNAAACDNLAKMVKGAGHRSEMRPEAGNIYAVTIFVGRANGANPRLSRRRRPGAGRAWWWRLVAMAWGAAARSLARS